MTTHGPRQFEGGIGCACGKTWPCPTQPVLPASVAPRPRCLTASGATKVGYQTRTDARQAARRTQRRSDSGDRLQVYKCPDCDLFHIGHTYGPGAPRR